MRTAACDKHATYEHPNGPSGTGVDDLYTPEAEANGAKKSITLTEANDEFKVKAVINQIRGFDHTGTTQVGVPAIFGMNFQSINIGQKIAGYTNAAGTPTAGLAQAFDYVDGALGRIVAELQAQGLLDSTRIVFTVEERQRAGRSGGAQGHRPAQVRRRHQRRPGRPPRAGHRRHGRSRLADRPSPAPPTSRPPSRPTPRCSASRRSTPATTS